MYLIWSRFAQWCGSLEETICTSLRTLWERKWKNNSNSTIGDSIPLLLAKNIARNTFAILKKPWIFFYILDYQIYFLWLMTRSHVSKINDAGAISKCKNQSYSAKNRVEWHQKHSCNANKSCSAKNQKLFLYIGLHFFGGISNLSLFVGISNLSSFLLEFQI
jgi:hypothetical protein